MTEDIDDHMQDVVSATSCSASVTVFNSFPVVTWHLTLLDHAQLNNWESVIIKLGLSVPPPNKFVATNEQMNKQQIKIWSICWFIEQMLNTLCLLNKLSSNLSNIPFTFYWTNGHLFDKGGFGIFGLSNKWCFVRLHLFDEFVFVQHFLDKYQFIEQMIHQ